MINNIQGYLQSRIVFYLMNVHHKKRTIWFARVSPVLSLSVLDTDSAMDSLALLRSNTLTRPTRTSPSRASSTQSTCGTSLSRSAPSCTKSESRMERQRPNADSLYVPYPELLASPPDGTYRSGRPLEDVV